jgi:hypothetical protein
MFKRPSRRDIQELLDESDDLAVQLATMTERLQQFTTALLNSQRAKELEQDDE